MVGGNRDEAAAESSRPRLSTSVGWMGAGVLLGWFAHTWITGMVAPAEGDGGVGIRDGVAGGASLLGRSEGSAAAGGAEGEGGDSFGGAFLPDEVAIGGSAAERFQAIVDGSPGSNHLGALQWLAANASVDELAGLYERVWNWSGSPDYVGPLLEVWARRDPRGAVGHLRHDARGAAFRERIGRVHAVWALSDREAALESALGLDRPADRKTAVEHLLSGLGASDGAGALAVYERLPGGLVDEGWFFDTVFGKWSFDDPGGAAAVAASMAPSENRSRALAGVARGWAEQDPEAALAWAGTFSGADRDRLVHEAIQRWTADDPFAAWDELDRHVGASEARAFRDQAIDAMVRLDPVAAIERIEALPPGERRIDLLEPVARELAAVDPIAAVAFHEAHRAALGDQAHDLVASISREWARSDPAGAFDWLDAFAPDHRVYGAMQVAAEQWARSDPQAAFDRLRGLTEGPHSAALARPLFEVWGKEDPVAALEAAVTLEDREVAEWGVSATLNSWAAFEPGRALDVAFAFPADEDSSFDPMELLGRVARDNPRTIAEWMAAREGFVPDGATVARVAGAWMGADPAGFASWLRGLPPGEARDTGIANLLNRTLESDPAGARRWLSELSTAELQETWRLKIEGE